MYWSETRSIYAICILSGVLSIGVVAGPELAALLHGPAANVTPTVPAARAIPRNPAITPAPNPARIGEVMVPAQPLTPTPSPVQASPAKISPVPASLAPAQPPPKAEPKTSAITLIPPAAPTTPFARAGKAQAPALPNEATSAKPVSAKPAVTTPTRRAVSSPAPARAATPLARGRQLTRLFYAGQLEQVWAAFLPPVRHEWGTFAAFQAYRAGGARMYGAETQVLRERVIRNGAFTYYTRTATFERGPSGGWTVIFSLDARGDVREFGIVGADLLPDRRARRAR